MKLGRNDPCFCGSGQKYKRCCFGKVGSEAAPTGANASSGTNALNDPSAREAFFAEPPDVMSPDYWDRLEKRLPRKLNKDDARLFEKLKASATFEIQRSEIEAAHETLEKYRKKFERFTRKTHKFLKRAEKLFDEEPFEGMRFTADDMQRAFEKLGFPQRGAGEAWCLDSMQKTVKFLLDDDQREVLARQLLQLLPTYVAAGRHIDAWIIQHSAILMVEEPSEACGPFLVCMVMHGLRDWEDKREREQLTMLRKLGVDPDDIRRRGMNGVESLLQEMMEQDDASDKLEEFLDAHPDLKGLCEAQCRAAEAAAIELLQREDTRSLLLAPEEIEPWFPVFEQHIKAYPNHQGIADNNKKPDDALVQQFFDLIYVTCGKLAGEVFTKPRRDRLTKEIRRYGRKLRRKDAKGKAGTDGLLMAAQSPEPPADNHVLTMLCMHSFMQVMNDIQNT